MSMVRYIDELTIKDKRVFIRADFNVPLDQSGEITSDNRIRSTLPTIQSILER
ncbi:MAG: phosphoglycerate kinase, partial [Thermodesulfobacteriota bacterium]|nr:phosphoglycerate kinase [Thermodesulfobacteriota bacterium]